MCQERPGSDKQRQVLVCAQPLASCRHHGDGFVLRMDEPLIHEKVHRPPAPAAPVALLTTTTSPVSQQIGPSNGKHSHHQRQVQYTNHNAILWSANRNTIPWSTHLVVVARIIVCNRRRTILTPQVRLRRTRAGLRAHQSFIIGP